MTPLTNLPPFIWVPKAPHTLRLLMAAAILLGLLGFAPAKTVSADADLLKGYTVDTLEDDYDLWACTPAPGDCSLRGAVRKANSVVGANTIFLPAGTYYLGGGPLEDKNQSGDLDIPIEGGSLTVIGEGSDVTVIDGRGADRLFDLIDYDDFNEVYLSLSKLTLRNGSSTNMNDGGLIKSYSSIYLDQVLLQNGRAYLGGAIYAVIPYRGNLLIRNSMIRENTATALGGAIYVKGEKVTIERSSFDNNRSISRGGAIFNNVRQLSATDSTFFSNRGEEGGGITNYAFLGETTRAVFTNVTFAGNSQAMHNRSNGYYAPGTLVDVVLRNTILANSGGKNCFQDELYDGVVKVTDDGGNLDTGASCGLEPLKSGSVISTEPSLGAYQNNGGPTDTLALGSESKAINLGNPRYCSSRDQRGLSRVGVCDSGAYEVGASVLLYPSGGLARSVKVGDTLGSPLYLYATNAIGNPLEGWVFSYEVLDGAPVTLGSNRSISDESGRSNNTAAIVDDSPGPFEIAAYSGEHRTRFQITSTYSSAAPKVKSNKLAGLAAMTASALPRTGFAPGQVTRLPAQPAEKIYHAQDELRLLLPRLGISAPILGVPSVQGEWDLSWLWDQAGYLEGTAFPTAEGNSVITAHVFLPNGAPGPFAQLHTLAYNDTILIEGWGHRYVYEVRSNTTTLPTDLSPLAPKEKTWLTLITCRGYDAASKEYLARQVVQAVLVKID